MVYVTGMAWCTPLGDSIADVWDRMLAGQTGIRPVAHAGRLRNDLAATVSAADLSVSPRQRLHELTCRTLLRAFDEAGRAPSDPRTRVVLGTSLAAYLEDDPDCSLYAWAEAVGREIGLASPPIVVSTACSSGSDAILIGAELIRANEADCCICGGSDVLTWSKRIGHSSLGTMSPTFLRAFDERHDGTLLGEGAGFLVLEGNEFRGKPIAILRGAAAANDATGMTAADVTGLSARYAVERSLEDAGLTADSIALVNAHGSGTPMNDATEKNALADVFGRRATHPLVFATKGNFGHSLGATGALEAIALIEALRTGQVPPVVGLDQPDPEFPLPVVHSTASTHSATFGLSLTLGFGGFDTSLIFEGTR